MSILSPFQKRLVIILMWTAVEINMSKITVNISGFVSVCKAKQMTCLEAAVQTKI